MRRLLLLFFGMLVLSQFMLGQNVNINATGGTPFATYPTLNAAFAAVNAGTHTGQILVTIAASTTEGATQAVLAASGTGAANYTKLYVTPTAPGLSITGTPAAGTAVVKLNGADNVTFNGTLNGGSGGTRDLSIINQNATPANNTAAIWVASLGTALGATGDTLMNLNIKGVSNSNSYTSFGIYAGGTTITGTGTGADNDNLTIRNNAVDRAYTAGIYVRGTTTGLLDGLMIQNNAVGSNTATDYVILRGIDVQNATSPEISGNTVFNMFNTYSVTNAAIDVGGSTTGAIIRRNRIYGIYSQATDGWGAYGINLNGGNNHQVFNNMVYDLQTIRYSITSTTWNAFGIRVAAGTGHKIYYNSVNLYGTVTIGTASAMSAAFCVTATSITGLDVRNNIFQNRQDFGGTAKAYAAFFPSGYSYSTGTFNYNIYAVPSANTVNTSYFVAYTGSDILNVPAYRTATSQNANSQPVTNQLVPFAANNDLHVPVGPSINESTGINIAGYTVDFDGDIRQGNAGYSHVPAGTAPDIGCDETATTPTDYNAPTFSGLAAAPGSSCTAVSHTISVVITDASGVANASILWSVNGVAQTPIVMTNTSGNTWQGTIPANGSASVSYSIRATDASPQSNIGNSSAQSYADAYLSVSLGADFSNCSGLATTLVPATSASNNIKITEVTHFRTGTGQTNPYPAWIPTGPDDYCEITNLGNAPVSLNGWNFTVVSPTILHDLTFSNLVIMPGQVIVIGLGTGTDDPQNGYYVTGESSGQLSSTTLVGFILRKANGNIVDVVGSNGYVFSAGSGVTSADWSGNIPSISGLAGAIRTVSDNNTASDWVGSSTVNPQTLGALNPTLSVSASPSLTWSTGATSSTLSVAPVTTTTYTVTVSDGVCSASDDVVVTVVPLPANPLVVNDTICGLNSFTVSASSVDAIRWYDAPTAGTLVNTGSTLSGTTSTTQLYYIEAYNGTCSSSRVLGQVYVIAPDTAYLNFSGDTLCLGDVLTIVGTSANANYSYSWSGDSLMSSAGDTVMANPSTGSTQYVLVATDGFCTYTDSAAVWVNPVPMVTATTTAPPSAICISDTIMLYGSAFVGNDTTLLAASPGASILDLQTTVVTQTLSGLNRISMVSNTIDKVCLNITHTWDGDMGITLISPQGTSLALSSFNGGSGDNYTGTCFTMSAPTNITAGAPPFAGNFLPQGAGGFSVFNGENPNGVWSLSIYDQANGDIGTLTNWSISFVDTISVSVEWSDGGTIATTDTVAVTPVTTTTYTYTATNNFTGCSKSESFTVNVNPALSVAISGAPVTVCTGSVVNLSSTVSGGDGSYSYNWVGLGTGSGQSVTVSGPTTVILEVMDGCSTPMAADTITIGTFSPVSATITGPSTTCAGSPITLSAAGAAGDGIYAYMWSTGATTASISPSPSTATTYTVTVTDGCGTTVVQSQAVTVSPLAVGSFTWAQTGVNTVTFTNTSQNGTTYSWDFGDGQTSTTMSPAHTYATNGTYTVVLTVTNSCGSVTTTQTVDVLLSLEDFLGNGNVTVFPNPSNGQFNVRFSNLEGKALNLIVFDLRGERVHNQLVTISGQVMETPVDLSGLSKGMYFVQVSSGTERQTIKVVVE